MNTSEYDFIKINPHLGRNIIFLTYGGSYSYGTNIEGSDIDIRGCTLNSKYDLLGRSNFQQYEDKGTDTVIYGFNKLIGLISNCNPNTIEMLGCKPEHYFSMTPIGKELIDNYHMFLSKKAIHSFGEYANQQLRRLENSLARDTYTQAEKERHILNSIRFAMQTFKERYQEFEDGAIELYISDSQKVEMDTEIFMNIKLSHYPLRDYKGLWSEMNSIVKDYSNLNGRNRKKDDLHLNKHAMHLIRLYLMCLDILEKEEIITYRESDHDLLMSIRNGEYQKEDGSFRKEFFEMVSQYEDRLEYAKNNTALPEQPDHKKIEEFVISINERVIRNDY